VDSGRRTTLMDFIKNLEVSFEAVLKEPTTWRIDFSERTSYGVKGDAQRCFTCEIFIITADQGSDELKDLI